MGYLILRRTVRGNAELPEGKAQDHIYILDQFNWAMKPLNKFGTYPNMIKHEIWLDK